MFGCILCFIFHILVQLGTVRSSGVPPIFFYPDTAKTEFISENSSPGTIVFTVIAADQDGDTLTYSKISQTPPSPDFPFNTNELVSPSGLDSETTTSFAFQFSVTDGTSAAVTSPILTINIVNINDNPPTFNQTSYTATVYDTVTDGSHVISISATDADVSHSLIYAITAGDTLTTFTIGASSGDISVNNASNLDPSATPTYTLTLEVTDGANIDMTNLSIRVVDDPCSPDPCQNSGTCTRSGTSFTCNCQLGWGGKTCANECEDPTPTNGTALFPGGLPNGQLAQIDCNTGFNRIGHDLIFCDKGTWSDTTTCEIAECGDPKPTFGSSNHTDTTYLATAWIDCNTGYNRNGPSFIECQDGNSWSGTPTCLPMDCGDPTPSSGSANGTTYTYGAALEIECTTGYNIIGSSVIVCQTDGTWSDSPTCNQSDCLSPTIINGDTPLAPKGTTYGALAILTCLEGYIMNGDAFVTCQEDSTWSTLPSCDLRDCGDPKPSDSSANDTTFTYGTTLEIECTAGYDIIGSSVILCQTDGTWSDSPTCNPSDCGTLMIADGQFSAVSGTTLGQHATLTCDIGYNHSGNSTISCTDSGWNGTATCTIKERLNVTMILLAILGGVVVMEGVMLIIIVVNILKSKASAPPGKLIHGQHVHTSV